MPSPEALCPFIPDYFLLNNFPSTTLFPKGPYIHCASYIDVHVFHSSSVAGFYFPLEGTARTNVLSSVITTVSSTPDLPVTKGQNVFKFNIRERVDVKKYLFYGY